MNQPEPYIIHPTSKHTHTIILLHGLGGNGETFGSALMQHDNLSSLSNHIPGMKYIFPTALGHRSAALKRLRACQWFHVAALKNTSYRSDLQLDGMQQSAKQIRSIIHLEIVTYGIPPRNICLGGLSQGYAMSVAVLLSLEYPLGGFVGMSGWLPFRKEADDLIKEGRNRSRGTSGSSVDAGGSKADNVIVFREADENEGKGGPNQAQDDPLLQTVSYMRSILSLDDDDDNVNPLPLSRDRTCRGTPVFLAHGVLDPKILVTVGEKAANTLKSIGLDVIWKTYANLGHWYEIPQEIDDIIYFLRVKMG